MNELNAYTYDDMLDGVANVDIAYYPKSEADKVIAELEESHKKEVGQLLIEIAEQKSEIEHWKFFVLITDTIVIILQLVMSKSKKLQERS